LCLQAGGGLFVDYNDIENLKQALSNLARQGCRLRIPSHGIDGKVIGVGFKPFWTGSVDTKIEKLEFDYIDSTRRAVTFSLYNITDYSVISHDGKGYDSLKNAGIDFKTFSPGKNRGEESYEKVHIDIVADTGDLIY
jgi:hypothetical protein